ncbi:MAG: hypothetical protein U9N62_08805 [Thermotogota bacterium]|nr:hypothetical protein [Thermotogota bacterium]
MFQDRYKSEAVETDDYFKTVIRYIHRNPLKAGIVKRLEDYSWSSYRGYLSLNETYHVDKDFVLKLFNEDQTQGIKDFKAFNEIENGDRCLDISNKKRMSDEMAIRIIKKKFSVNSAKDINNFDPEQKQVCVVYFLENGLSVLQISRVTGISRYFIYESRK